MAVHLAAATLDALLDASIAGGLAIAIAWLICRDGRLRPRWQVLIWWAASLKLLTALAGVPAIPLPLLPATTAPSGEPATQSTSVPMAASAGTSLAAAPPARMLPSPASSEAAATTQPLSAPSIATLILAGLWLLGVVVAAARFLLSHLHLQRLMRRALPADDELAACARQAASRAGVRRVPPTWTSEDIQTPQTIGALRPAILLPTAAPSGWTRDELRMALSHEMAHVRRRDLLWGWIPLVAQSLFFFHPLARIAAREYLIAREAACDAEAIDTTQASPADYARLLVRLGIERSGGAFAAGGASDSRSVLTRRLEMLVASPRNLSRPGRVALAGLAALALLPLELSARQTEAPRAVTAAPSPPLQAARPVTSADPTQPARPVSAAPAAPPRPARPVARAVQQTPAPAQTQPSSPVPSPAPRPVEPAQSDEAALQTAFAAARRAAAEREREATAAAREMRALERALQQERERALDASAEAQTQIQQAEGRVEQFRREIEARATLQLEAARDALRAQNAPDSRSQQERTRNLEEMARQLEARRASPQAAGASPDDRMRLLRERLQLLAAQQQSLLDEQQALAHQQQALVDTQRRLAEELARVREALDAAR